MSDELITLIEDLRSLFNHQIETAWDDGFAAGRSLGDLQDKAEHRIIKGAREAVAIAKGEAQPAAVHYRPSPEADHAARVLASIDVDKLRALVEAVGPCVKMLKALVAESGRSVEWGEEDAFRMGEWFEKDELEAIENARAALAALQEPEHGN